MTWFETTAQRHFERFLAPAAGHPIDALQIGAFRGDASAWLLDNILTHPESTLTDVDTWAGSPDEEIHQEYDWDEVYAEYLERVGSHTKVDHFRGTSDQFFARYPGEYDFIYVDGSHTGLDVLRDAANAWDALKRGGIIAFDDYTWGGDRAAALRPHEAIDAFVNIVGNDATLIHRGHQLWLAKHHRPIDAVMPGTVAIGLTAGTHSITSGFRHSMSRLMMADARDFHRVAMEISKVAGTCGVPAARNEIVQNFLDMVPKAEWLWFVDADATFATDILEVLLAAAHPTERPIMGGLAFRMSYGKVNDVLAPELKMEPMLYARIDGHHVPIVKYPANAIIKVDGLPCHCLLIHRSVLNDPRWKDDGHFHPWFRMSEINGQEMSEDFFFCKKAQDLGYPIHACTKAKTGHEKTLVFDEGFYFRMYPELLEPDRVMRIERKDHNDENTDAN